MKISSFALKNYRRLVDVNLVLDDKTTVLVGANNSGKTSCIGALHTFLKSPDNLKVRDISKRNWKEIQKLGKQIEQEFPTSEKMQELSDVLTSLLPILDIEITAEVNEAYKVRDILPDLEWRGGALFVRITYEATDISKLCREFVDMRGVVSKYTGQVSLWPKDLCDFLEKGSNLSKFIKQKHYILSKGVEPTSKEVLQPLKSGALKKLIRVDVESEQRGSGDEDNTDQKGPYSEKQRLNKLLRGYYDRILNPEDFPEPEDLEVLGHQQNLEEGFTSRLNDQFNAPFEELKNMGYPGIGGNPTVEIAAKISGTDALQKSSSVRYRFDTNEEEFLPESYLGLGYQNLIYLTFRLLEFRDKWMRVGKSASSEDKVEDQIEPIHLVLLEEPEVNLHAQVQRVFVSKAYDTLRNHPDLRDKATKKDKSEYQTQLVISTHSSHIINDIDFKDLRYFRRNDANKSIKMDHTSIANMSELFAKAKDELLFVRKHLKLTHCDIFFADGVIFVEGQAESLLVPEFISKSFPKLSSRYISMLEVNGAHTHKYRNLVEKLGVATLVLTDLDSVNSEGKSCFPQQQSVQKTNNDTLKKWHPKKEALDDLVTLPQAEHATTSGDAPLYVAYQKPTQIFGEKILSRTFEDALILANFADDYFQKIKKLKDAKTDFENGKEPLSKSLFDYVQGLKKGDFAFNCLFHLAENEANSFNPPEYMSDGLTWLQDQLSPKA
ncbi:AAA family ATPase [Vibrio parahaemolyticus]|uniref:ATP-dependent nuclease n=1 Tax=Vibrio TaxID=662 RepID=UPI00040BA7AA|nr:MULTISPECIES: AAA family ATPase [Vibrio]EGQ7764643.1 AAA family ATPase [Vibrio alginolyticus]EGQ8498766.1 AAA family ATPase [Vibrio alginolyticus]EGQ9112702.1 AAA family ATPase [Vibrio alginolyticus]EGQ9697647.1 AAA family ATPase [Vibrio parahaemolyticus]EGR1586357.1 ATP-dependent endonuclease [Vibrio parahaemolyticus]